MQLLILGTGCAKCNKLYEAVKTSGLQYMMFETSCYHADLYAMRTLYDADKFGKLVYSEGEYFHYACAVIDSYKDWRDTKVRKSGLCARNVAR